MSKDKDLDLEGLVKSINAIDTTDFGREYPDIVGPGNAGDLSYVLDLFSRYEQALSSSGTSKWFVPGTPFSIEHCPKHKAFFDAGIEYPERFLCSANRAGKTICGAYEVSCHLTGNYPEWWVGKRFDKPIAAWAVGPDAKTTRDTVQKELLGPIGGWGSGMIPKDLLRNHWSLSGVPQGIDTIEIVHRSGGISTIGFKNCEQDIKAFYGTAKDCIWIDEECPENVYNECLLRTMTTNGITLLTFTPLHGLTPLVVKYFSQADFLAGARGVHSSILQEHLNKLEEKDND